MTPAPQGTVSLGPWVLLGLAAGIAALIGAQRAPGSGGAAHTPVRAQATETSGSRGGLADPAPVHTPEQSLALFSLVPGFRIECIAAEPMVEAPVAIAFDEDGRAWVVEMRGYMPDAEGRGEDARNGRIVVLEDTDEDGVFDSRTVFLDGLVLPRAVMPCYGGALVLEPPRLLFCRDTDGDGAADSRRELLTGLGGQNPEHAPNGLIYGMDNWIHLSQSNIELRFDGEKVITRKTPGHGQWGITQDQIGRLYYTPNSEALRGDLYPKHYGARNPDQRGAEGINRLVCRDQAVWPARPTPGVNRGYQKGTLREDGRLANHTAACGPVIYDASLFPTEFRGNAFICEPAAFLVRRLVLEETDSGPQARSAYDRREFLTSTDERFRPVNACVGPDGALYIADMHRGVIQHKTYLTPYLKAQVHARGLERPLHMGRIYRVAPDRSTPAARERLSGAYEERLVELLGNPDAWWRRTAQRLLVEREATSAAESLRGLLVSDAPGPARLHALWTLEGIGALTWGDITAAAADRDGALRSAAARLSEPVLAGGDGDLDTSLGRLIADPDRMVRVQAVLSLGEVSGERSAELLRRALEAGREDGMIRGAVISGLRGRSLEFLRSLVAGDWMESGGGRGIVADLCDCILRSSSKDERAALVELIVDLGAGQASRAEFILARLRRAQQLDGENARILEISREPRGWGTLIAAADALGKGAGESDYYLTWPGKPRVDPPRRMRPLSAREFARFEAGGGLFGGGCAACHGHDGTGIPGQIPPLAGSARAQGNEARAVRILLNGLEGTLDNSAGTFNGSMPPAPFSSDEDVAAVLTYIRRAWGNAGDPVSPERVRTIRGQTKGRNRPWTAAELESVE